MPHIIEIWTMAGGDRASYTAACLSCGWVGERGSRPEAEREGRRHEEGGHHAPWISALRASTAAPRHGPDLAP